MINFYPKLGTNKKEPCRLTLKAGSEHIINVPTHSKGLGLLSKEEILPEVYVASSLTRAVNGVCATSVINTNETDMIIQLPRVTMEGLYTSEGALTLTASTDSSVSSRLSSLHHHSRLGHLISEERSSIVSLCEKFNDLFHLPGDKLACTSTIEHAIPTPTVDPHRAINVRPYRIPEIHKQEVQKQTEQMLADGVIQYSTSPWNSPILVVPKNTDFSGKVKGRVVVDFRKLNDVTIGDSFPIPIISDLLNSLGNSRYFSSLDCPSGFCQIPVRVEDRPKTAFSTDYGNFEYKSMPFGLKGAPATFERLMFLVLSGMQGLKSLFYLDDLLIFGETEKVHNDRLRDVFARLRMHNLKLQQDKCKFLRKEVTYLGHKLTTQGLFPDSDKVKVVKEFPVPSNTRQLKGFLGLAGYYRRFIPNFSEIAKPLTQLLKRNTPFVWNQRTDEAFNTLKKLLTEEPLLQYPDFTKPFVLTTDASNEALGAILSQSPVGQDLPVAYASRTLINAEKNYSTTEKELLAIVWGCKQYRHYLLGRKFTIVIDHKPLTWVFNIKDPSSRVLRWRLKLEEYDYHIVYKPGIRNTNADALSRINTAEINPVTETGSVLTEEEKREILQEFHEQPIRAPRNE
jgi:hypothetical protein